LHQLAYSCPSALCNHCHTLYRYRINITVLTLESPSSSLLAWRKDNPIFSAAPARWHALLLVVCADHPSSNDRHCCLGHDVKQRSPTNAIECTLLLYPPSLMWFRFIRAPSSHGCISCAADTRISLTLTRYCSTQCVVIDLLLHSSWYWYWWCAITIPSSIHLQGSRARVSGE